jgi:protocatechuate 3,4-dioxygenase beta subunit
MPMNRWSSFVAMLLVATPLLAAGPAAPDLAAVRLAAQRALAERNGQPAPPDPVWADDLEGRGARAAADAVEPMVPVNRARAMAAADWKRQGSAHERQLRERPGARAAEARAQIAARRALRPTAAAEGTASIAGRITRSANGTAVAGLGVFLYDWDTESFFESTTAANGRFSFQGLAAGTYELWTTGSDFLTGANYGGGPCFVDRCPYSSELIDVEDGAALTGYDLEVDPAGVVIGTVRARERDTGTLVAQAFQTVECYTFDEEDRLFVSYVETDAEGAFRIAGVPVGSWWLTTFGTEDYVGELWPDTPCPGGGCAKDRDRFSLEVTGGDTQAGFDFVLEPGRNIKGRVTRQADGLAIEGVDVDIFDSATGLAQGYVSTDAEGNYRSFSLPPGTYEAVTYSNGRFAEQIWDGRECRTYFDCLGLTGDPIEVTAEADREGVDFALADAATITGHLRRASDNQPVGGWVEVYGTDGTYLDGTAPDETGLYTMTGLGAGSYFLRAYDDNFELVPELWDNHPCLDLSCDPTAGDSVTVAHGDTAMADFTLEAPVLLSGTVTGETLGAGSAGAQSAPISFAGVTIEGENGGLLGTFLTQSDGSWSVVALADTYRLEFNAFGYRSEVFDDLPCGVEGCDRAAGTAVELAPGEERTDLDAELGLGGVLAGQVTVKASGAPVGGARIDLYFEASPGAFSFSTSRMADQQGRWQVSGLYPSNYKVRVRPGPKYRPMLYPATACDFLQCTVSIDGLAIPLADDERRTDIDVAVARAAVVTGKVRAEASGRPIRSGQVRLWDLDRRGVVFQSLAPNGGYRIGSLPPGRYLLSVSPYNGRFLGEAWPNSPCPFHECYLSGEALELEAPGFHPGYDFALGPAAVVSGIVRDADTGEGIAGAAVLGINQGFDLFSGFVYTDEQGRFLMGGLAPGPMQLGVMTSATQFGFDFGQEAADYVDTFRDGKLCSDFTCDPRPLEVLELEVGRRSGVVIEQRRGAVVSGSLAVPGVPEPDGEVWLLDLGGAQGVYGLVRDGSWTVDAVPPGRYYLWVSSGGRSVLYPDQDCDIGRCDLARGELIEVGEEDIEGIAVALDAPASGILEVRVVVGPEQTPRGGARLTLHASDGDQERVATTRRSGDHEGEVTFTALAAGTYYLRAASSGWVPAVYPDVPCPGTACDETIGMPIVIDDSAAVVAVTIHLSQPEATLRGRVVDAEGDPLPGLFVTGYDPEGTPLGAGGVEWDGSYLVEQLPAGVLLQATSWIGADWIGQAREGIFCSREVCDWDAAERVEVEPGDEVSGLDFVMEPGGSLQGRVLEAETGVPLFGVAVEVRTAEGLLVSGPTSNPDGFWRSAALPPGRYRVRTVGTVGYTDVTLGGAACDPDCPFDQGNDVLITEPGKFEGFDLVLPRE